MDSTRVDSHTLSKCDDPNIRDQVIRHYMFHMHLQSGPNLHYTAKRYPRNRMKKVAYAPEMYADDPLHVYESMAYVLPPINLSQWGTHPVRHKTLRHREHNLLDPDRDNRILAETVEEKFDEDNSLFSFDNQRGFYDPIIVWE